MDLVTLTQNVLAQFQREVGDHPREMTFGKKEFDHMCAEATAMAMRQDKSVLSIIESFKIAGPRGWVTINRAKE